MTIKVRLSLAGNLKHFGKTAGAIVDIPLEDYVKGVVAAEMGNAPLEACRAQAVAARTYAYNNAQSGKAIDDSARSAQAFIAARIKNRTGYPNAHQGVDDTAGQILTYQGLPIGRNALYSSANNGTTKNRKHAWPGSTDLPYLLLRADPWTQQEIQKRKAAGQSVRYGHGVGMSQYGAMHAARQGIGYQEILAFYYPGTQISGGVVPAPVPVGPPPKSQALVLAERMADFARSKIGGAYVFGASGPVNFDCSGFIRRIGAQIGFDLYHGATSLWLNGFKTGNAKKYGYWAESGTINTLPADATAILFNQDKNEKRHLVMAHTGLYDGLTGNVIQAGGYYRDGARGVWEGAIDKRRWTHWAIIKGTKISGGSDETMANILRRGSVGSAVREMQAALIERGFDLGSYGADGKFGATTETAVMAFQRLNGLPANGAWGADEQAKLTARPEAPGDVPVDTAALLVELEGLAKRLQAIAQALKAVG